MAENVPLNLAWAGPPLTSAECRSCYERYLTWRQEYYARSLAYASSLTLAPNDFQYVFAVGAHKYLERPPPGNEWDYTMPPLDQAQDGDWWDYEQGTPGLSQFDEIATLCRYWISGSICRVMWQIDVAAMVLDAYNVGTGGPGGLVVTERR